MTAQERDVLLGKVKDALRIAQGVKARALSLFEMMQAVDSVRDDSSLSKQPPAKT